MFIYLTGHYKNLENIIGFRIEVMDVEFIQHVLNRILRMDSNRFSNELKFSIENYWYNYGFLINGCPIDFQQNSALKNTTIRYAVPPKHIFTKIEYKDYMMQMIRCKSKPNSNDPSVICSLFRGGLGNSHGYFINKDIVKTFEDDLSFVTYFYDLEGDKKR